MTKYPEAFLRWQADYRRHLATRPDDYPHSWLTAEDKERLRAEDREREKAYEEEWKAWHAAAVRGMRGPGHPPSDTDALVNAATWLVHLFPRAERPETLAALVNELHSSPVDAVRAVVRNVKPKTLRNKLAPYQRDILLPEPWALSDAAQWAEEMRLPALPLELFAETVLLDMKFLRADRVVRPIERHGMVLARAVRDCCGVADMLPPEAQKALQWWLQRLAKLSDDEMACLAVDRDSE
jgi:hypothetical protein